MKEKNLRLLDVVAQAIFDKKGSNIIALDVRKFSGVTDYCLIAEGIVERHVIALADEIQEQLAKQGERVYQVEGGRVGDWVVLDYVDFVVHLFIPEVREKYALEELWKEGVIVDLNIIVERKESAI